MSCFQISKNLHFYQRISLEDYRKSLIDFKISWSLFEKFCNTNNTKILWSTYFEIDSDNFEEISISENFFKIDTDDLDKFLNSKLNLKINKNSLKFRDGHNGELIKEYWYEMFLKEIQERGYLNNEKK